MNIEQEFGNAVAVKYSCQQGTVTPISTPSTLMLTVQEDLSARYEISCRYGKHIRLNHLDRLVR